MESKVNEQNLRHPKNTPKHFLQLFSFCAARLHRKNLPLHQWNQNYKILGLLDFLFGKQKHHTAPDLKAQSQRYNQGYHDGYRDAYEEGTCEDWDCTCENQDFDPSDSSSDSYPDEDTFQEDDYDHFEEDPEFDPEAEY